MPTPVVGPDPFSLILQNVALNQQQGAQMNQMDIARQQAQAAQQSEIIKARANLIGKVLENSDTLSQSFGSDVPRNAAMQGLNALAGVQLSPQTVQATNQKGDTFDTINAQRGFADILQSVAKGMGPLRKDAGVAVDLNQVLQGGSATPEGLTLQKVPTAAEVAAAARVASARSRGGGGSQRLGSEEVYVVTDNLGNKKVIKGTDIDKYERVLLRQGRQIVDMDIQVLPRNANNNVATPVDVAQPSARNAKTPTPQQPSTVDIGAGHKAVPNGDGTYKVLGPAGNVVTNNATAKDIGQ